MQDIRNPEIVTAETNVLRLAALSVTGDRAEQQDQFGYCLDEKGNLAVVADGMGGMHHGREAGRIAAQTVLEAFSGGLESADLLQIVFQAAKEADRRIGDLRNEEGEPMGAGSTLVSVIIRDKAMNWCSVGDSRGYLLRDGAFVQFTKDLNYRAVLEEQLSAHLISEEDYQNESKQGEALISYLGIGDLSLIDYSSRPFPLKAGDRLILTSDGLYRLVPDESIKSILLDHREPPEALEALEKETAANAQAGAQRRDNMTVIIIDIK